MTSPVSVSVDDAVQVCEKLIKCYREGWPQSFHKTLTKQMMSVSRKNISVGSVTVFRHITNFLQCTMSAEG